MNDDVGVHINHCCVLHGCKYGDDDCPVAYGDAKQKYPCEWCRDGEKYYSPLNPPEPPPKRIIKEGVSKEFLKGMLYAFLITVLLHIGIAYVILS